MVVRSSRIYVRLLLVTAVGIAAIWLLSGQAFIVGKASPEELAAVDPGFGSDAFEPFIFLHFGDLGLSLFRLL